MAMPGRKPKPTELHKLEGTYNATKHGTQRRREPKAEGNLADAPEGLTDQQRDAWDYALAHAPKGILRKIDRGMLLAWVLAEDRLRLANEMLAKADARNNNALPLLSKSGDLIGPNPYVGIMEKSSVIMARLAGELGFSPAARPRMAVPIGPGEMVDPPKRGRGRPRKQPPTVFGKLALIYGGSSDNKGGKGGGTGD